MENLTLRRAGIADVGELVRLRALMFGEMAEGSWPWEQECREMLGWRLTEEASFAAYVVGSPQPGGPLVSSGFGWVNLHLPGPTTPDGRRGHIGSVCTDVAARRRGHAHAVLQALLSWFDGLGVTRIDLRAAPMGAGLYRRLGFGPLGGEGLSRVSIERSEERSEMTISRVSIERSEERSEMTISRVSIERGEERSEMTISRHRPP